MLIVFKSAVPFLGIYTKEILTCAYKKAYARVFMAAAFITVKSKKLSQN